jgi:hypothetical protein
VDVQPIGALYLDEDRLVRRGPEHVNPQGAQIAVQTRARTPRSVVDGEPLAHEGQPSKETEQSLGEDRRLEHAGKTILAGRPDHATTHLLHVDGRRREELFYGARLSQEVDHGWRRTRRSQDGGSLLDHREDFVGLVPSDPEMSEDEARMRGRARSCIATPRRALEGHPLLLPSLRLARGRVVAAGTAFSVALNLLLFGTTMTND